MNFDEIRKRSSGLIERTVEARDWATRTGTPSEIARKIGADAEDVSRDCLALLDMVDDLLGEARGRSRVIELVAELYSIVHPAERVDLAPDAYPVEAPATFGPDDLGGSDFGDPDEPVRSTPVEDDAVRVEADGKQTTTPAIGGDPALPVVKKRRAPEALKPIAEWELSGADFRALPFDRAWVESQLPAFRAEQGEGSAARPRVVFAAWLAKREGAGEHKRAAE